MLYLLPWLLHMARLPQGKRLVFRRRVEDGPLATGAETETVLCMVGERTGLMVIHGLSSWMLDVFVIGHMQLMCGNATGFTCVVECPGVAGTDADSVLVYSELVR